ncbi:hypothetical protein [Pseudoalteromonas arctica]|uniref:Uncharacterized protein n=1 Tax=Pseudoalteromonas arctica TaxID=394751 RepID=A0A7Y0DVG9_9GAMM|nr:hypothetical protein [Pseudoalteromonas arctica]NMM42258.1 hypothetical protein [Pseudoalteromonas arctica]
MIKLKKIEREKEDKNKEIIIGWAKKATRVNEGKFDNTILKVVSSAIAAFYDTNEEAPSYYLSDLIEKVLIDYIHKKLQCCCFQQLNRDIKDKFENLEKEIVSYCSYLSS